MANTTCPNCGVAVIPGQKFCMECVTPIPTKPLCSVCGAEIKPEQKFCIECGAKLTETATPQNINKPIESEDAKQFYELGEDYYYGRNGKDEDSTEATKWYFKAAELGYAPAQYSLGYCLNNGDGIEEDEEEAWEWVEKAAKQEYAPAQYWLGSEYCDRDMYDEAEEWTRKAAEQGHSDAQYLLGYIYYNICDNPEEGIKWYTKAAEQGNEDAIELLAELE